LTNMRPSYFEWHLMLSQGVLISEIDDFIAIVNLILFLVIVYAVKEVLDHPRLLNRYPCLRNYVLRIFLVPVVASPLIITLQPDWYWIGYITFNIGLIGALITLLYLFNNRLTSHD
jgi:hypothetical protein